MVHEAKEFTLHENSVNSVYNFYPRQGFQECMEQNCHAVFACKDWKLVDIPYNTRSWLRRPQLQESKMHGIRHSIFLLLLLSITLPWRSGHTLRINHHGDDASPPDPLSPSPTLIYRRRLSNPRSEPYHPSLYPPPSPPSNSIEEVKTESEPDNNNSEIYSRYPPTSSTTRRSRPKKSKRHRGRSRLRAVPPGEPPPPPDPSLPSASTSAEEYSISTSAKPTKPKTGRRRKVKRPNKKTPIVPSSPPEPTPDPASSTNSSSSGDKNLALEIGSEDGKYALIDKFFDDKSSSAPGLLSYAASSDFPRDDNKYTLGNVKENDIWLSDGHLLVLKGGDLDASLREHWKPIDSYQRGSRPPLRIALDSSNPPPFPVFVNETGPPVFLGAPPPPFGYPYPPPGSFNESFDPSRFPPPGMVPLYPNGSIPDFYRLPHFPGNNSLFPAGAPPPGQYGGGGGGYLPNNNTGYPPPYPFPPPGAGRPPFFPPGAPPPGFNRTGPPPGYPFLPPLVLNPHDNETDDPSIFLPPPYDFDYVDDNTTIVPPGPFAPGLVVPPPKNFYTVYNKSTGRLPASTSTQLPPLGLSYSFGNKRHPSQRPNGKKPQKFPITPPPDDSEEAGRPLATPPPTYVTYPAPVYDKDVVFTKKRKHRPPKLLNNILPTYTAEGDLGKGVVSQEPPPPPEEERPPLPLINHFLTNTLAPIPTSPKPPPNNYVYVRGQLKSLAELQQSQDPQGYDDETYEPTPRPPYDERGYPTRVIDDINLYDKNPKPTPLPDKSVYYNTPKYASIYNGGYTKKPKKSQNQYFSAINQNLDYGQARPSPRPQPQPILLNQQSPPIYLNNNGLTNQNLNQNLYHNNVNFQSHKQVTPIPYYNQVQQQARPPPGAGNNGIIQLQSPKSSYQNPRQPQLSYQAPNNAQLLPVNNYNNHVNNPVNNYNNGGSTAGGFRPAFGPSSPSQTGSRGNKALFPGTGRQNLFDYANPYFNSNPGQQPPPQVDGYYSPLTQYYQPFQSGGTNSGTGPYYQNNNAPRNYFSSNGANTNSINPYQQQQQQQFQPYFGQQQQQGTPTNGEYRSPLLQYQQQQQSPLSQDLYVNYREPLPQYNTESESVTTRTVGSSASAAFRAGPSKAPQRGRPNTRDESKTASSSSSGGIGLGAAVPPPADGTSSSYYSFQRGGPGGFSYKIKL